MRPLPGTRQLPATSGLTLIEVLLAIVIASLVIALVFSMYHAATRTVESQQHRRAGADVTTDALDQLARELACAFAQGDDEKCRFLLAHTEMPEGRVAELAFATAVPDGREMDLRWCGVARVSYRVVPGDDGARWLAREVQLLAGPGAAQPPQTNLLVRGILSFSVSVFDGSAWGGEWPVPEKSPCPQAARVELVVAEQDGSRPFRTETAIPAGVTISSTLERSAVPAENAGP